MEAAQLDTLLATIEEQGIKVGLQMLNSGTREVPPTAIGIAERDGKPVLALMPLLDLSQRFASLRHAAKETGIHGFVFLFDGIARNAADGQSYDAVLVVTCTRRSRRAKAIPYRRAEDGALLVGDPVEAPDEIAAEYQRALDVQPEPPASGPH